jgi:hypothetical protein
MGASRAATWRAEGPRQGYREFRHSRASASPATSAAIRRARTPPGGPRRSLRPAPRSAVQGRCSPCLRRGRQTQLVRILHQYRLGGRVLVILPEARTGDGRHRRPAPGDATRWDGGGRAQCPSGAAAATFGLPGEASAGVASASAGSTTAGSAAIASGSGCSGWGAAAGGAAVVGSAAAGAGLAGRLAPSALCCASRVSAGLALASACGSAAGRTWI